MRKFLLPLFLFVLTFSMIVPAEAQRRGSSGGRTRSSGSRSRSSGSVSVKGYYRKDGTYVRSHTRTSPNGTVYDNLSYRGLGLDRPNAGSSSPYTSLIGTHDYPLGVWADPKDKKLAYNTPFLGLTADYDADGLLVRDGARSSKVKKGWRVRSYRYKSQKTFIDVTNWRDLATAAMDSDENKIVVRGTRDNGKDFTEELTIQSPERFYGPDDAAPAVVGMEAADGYFIGVKHLTGDVPAVVGVVSSSSPLYFGMTIEGIRLRDESNPTPVKTWADVLAFLKAHPAASEVVVTGKYADGTNFPALVVAVNKLAV